MNQKPDQELPIKQVALEAALRILEAHLRHEPRTSTMDQILNETLATAKKIEEHLGT
jgi:predicted homoserine dehydrogenase-like protein